MIELNGVRVPGHNMTIRGTLRLEDKDLSGQTSASETAEEGIKPQVLAVSLIINMDAPEELDTLIGMARAVDDLGDRLIYDIVNTTANSARITRIKFTENLVYSENETQRFWQVNFTLRECQTVPEKIEERQEQPLAQEQTTQGNTVADASETPETKDPEYTGMKAWLKDIDNRLGS
ncbi:hypothetical protein [Endozoicomonas lisbonensis]|uniref:DNA-binding protein n=1 Tax=Endozoicomonas lisbonensis TaxID=3120522 RepID=A0ABV2SGZ3_9GAMM